MMTWLLLAIRLYFVRQNSRCVFPARSSHPFGRTFVSFHASFRSAFVPGVPSTFLTHLSLLLWTFDVVHDASSHVDRFVRRRRNAERSWCAQPCDFGWDLDPPPRKP